MHERAGELGVHVRLCFCGDLCEAESAQTAGALFTLFAASVACDALEYGFAHGEIDDSDGARLDGALRFLCISENVSVVGDHCSVCVEEWRRNQVVMDSGIVVCDCARRWVARGVRCAVRLSHEACLDESEVCRVLDSEPSFDDNCAFVD